MTRLEDRRYISGCGAWLTDRLGSSVTNIVNDHAGSVKEFSASLGSPPDCASEFAQCCSMQCSDLPPPVPLPTSSSPPRSKSGQAKR